MYQSCRKLYCENELIILFISFFICNTVNFFTIGKYFHNGRKCIDKESKLGYIIHK